MLRSFSRFRAASAPFRALTSVRFNSQAADVLAKYRQKLEHKAKALGLNNVDELNDALKDQIESKKKEMNVIDPLKELEAFDKQQAEKMEQNKKVVDAKAREPIAKDSPVAPYKTLGSFVDVEKFKDLNHQELELIWRARFQKSDRSLVGLLTAQQFASMYALAFRNRTFILPLPKEDAGYEMHFVQWAFVGPSTTHCMITTVAEYKLHKEYAKPHTTLMFHQELSHDKGIVFMNGTVEEDSHVTMEEAHLLVLNIQRFFGAMDTVSQTKVDLLRAFNSGSADFDTEKLIEEATSFD